MLLMFFFLSIWSKHPEKKYHGFRKNRKQFSATEQNWMFLMQHISKFEQCLKDRATLKTGVMAAENLLCYNI